ncbi:MAG: hypothetical protein BJ554DRAFT_7379 [Olpidium bornovanus]|uniref:glycerol kinase n=1 Tax=Olpidium bornovanus TaxID=278681 RepID=A0A8H7ZVX5_9FUNG|nr:MAG: hypothetical protein BJ554DRAFT_7379 [Olpidium bornovanus]
MSRSHLAVWCDTRTAHLVRVLSNRTPSKSSSHWMNFLLSLDAFDINLRSICFSAQHRCGLPITTYFSGVKLRWLLDNVPKVAEAAKMGNLRFGTVDSWLIYNMTGGSTGGGIHVTDVTNESRTMLMNLKTLKWDEELLR